MMAWRGSLLLDCCCIVHLAAGPWQISPEAAGPNMMHPLGDHKTSPRLQARLVAMLSRKGMSGPLVLGYART
jgi:hypothetical protein